MKKTNLLALLSWLAAAMAGAQGPAVDVEQLACLEVGQNGVVHARVANDIPGGEVRVYFRRLHSEVEDFYWVRLESGGGGEYWGVFPKPADEKLERHDLEALDEEVHERWARWWREKQIEDDRDPNDDLDQDVIRERAAIGRAQPRDWMALLDDTTLEDWLEELEYEPTEYFAAVYDGYGTRVAQSALRVVQVTDDCPVTLTLKEQGLAENLTVGETADWQVGERVFHWECDGVVSRVDRVGIWRGDESCRACVIAWWKRPAVIVPLGAAVLGGGIILLHDGEEASPFLP